MNERRSSRFRCSSVADPHHAEEVYCREATVVALATRCNSRGRRSCDLRVRRANFEDVHEETARSMWSPIDSCGFRSTSCTLRCSTRWAPGMIGSADGWSRVERRPTTIISLKDGFSMLFSTRELIIIVKLFDGSMKHR